MFNILQRNVVNKNAIILFNHIEKRSFFYWIDVIFNRVSKSRVKKLGPDRVCSEWLLRNGATVKFKNYKEFINDYNSLPPENINYTIQAVDATKSDIHDIGFFHFDGCKYIDDVKLIQCKKVSDNGILMLSFLKDSLTHLEIRDCKAVTHNSLYKLTDLSNLKSLIIGQLPYVENEADVISHLKEKLPNCKIIYENK